MGIKDCTMDSVDGFPYFKLLNEINLDELAATSKRKEHCQHSAHSLTAPEFVRRVHDIIDENRGKSMHNILSKIFKWLKEQQYIRNVLHQDLLLRRGQFMSTKIAQVNCLISAKPLLNKLKRSEATKNASIRMKKSIEEMISGYVQADTTEVPSVMRALEVSSNNDVANGGRPYLLKTQDWMDSRDFASSCHTEITKP
ncbi:hypothetical protein ACTXT7_010008 [Hymenolepis weldensis]